MRYRSEQTKPARLPTPEQFSTSERNIPESVHLFLKELFKPEKRSVSRSENITRVVEAHAADLVHGISRGEIDIKVLSVGIRNPQYYRFV